MVIVYVVPMAFEIHHDQAATLARLQEQTGDIAAEPAI